MDIHCRFRQNHFSILRGNFYFSLIASITVACGLGNQQPNFDSGVQASDIKDVNTGLNLAGGSVVKKDDGSAENPMGYTVLFGFKDKKMNSGAGNPCTGTLIDKQVILTAAHCEVAVGHEVISEAGGQINEYRVQKVIKNESFKYSDDLSHAPADFGLVLLDRETNGRPIELADKAPSPGSTVRVSGYGLYQNTIAEIEETKKMHGTEPIKDDTNLRTGTMTVEKVELSKQKDLVGMALITLSKGSAMTCAGDSGGGLIVNGRLAGVLHGGGRVSVSGGVSCNEKFYKDGYSAFASVAHQKTWIENNRADLIKFAKSQAVEKALQSSKDCSKTQIRPSNSKEKIKVYYVFGNGWLSAKIDLFYHAEYNLNSFLKGIRYETQSNNRGYGKFCICPSGWNCGPCGYKTRTHYHMIIDKWRRVDSYDLDPFLIYCRNDSKLSMK